MSEKIYAGFWIRSFAGILDFIFLMPLVLIAVYFSGISTYDIFNFSNQNQSFSHFSAASSNSYINIINYAVGIAYVAYFLSGKKQATIGKILLGIYVEKSDGSKVGVIGAIGRGLAAVLTSMTLGLGFIIVIFTKEKISLHDFICDTRVVYGKKK